MRPADGIWTVAGGAHHGAPFDEAREAAMRALDAADDASALALVAIAWASIAAVEELHQIAHAISAADGSYVAEALLEIAEALAARSVEGAR